MSIPTYAGIGTALSGLEAMQAGIDTTSENISNASDADYADEQVNLTDSPSLLVGAGGIGAPTVQMGTGVTIQSVTRSDDNFVDQQYWTANGSSSYDSNVASQLTNLQSDVSSSGTDTLQSAISGFYSSWNDLAGSPNSSAAAQNVVSTGQTLAQQINSVSAQINEVQSQASGQLAALTSTTPGSEGEVDQYATQIASLNSQIAGQTAAGLSANSLKDQRSAAIDNLSALVNVTVTPQSNGADTITLTPTDGTTPTTLVDGTQSNPANAVTIPTTWSAADGGTVGALAAMTSATGPVGALATQLNTLATQVSQSVNTASGLSFFNVTTAANGTPDMSVAATSSEVLTGASSASTVYAGEGSATDDYSTFIGSLGNTTQAAQDAQSTSQAVLTQVSNQRQSVSGVSLDQEMTNLITYQQGYQASAKVMNAMETVLQTLITSIQ